MQYRRIGFRIWIINTENDARIHYENHRHAHVIREVPIENEI
jgi:hypothetical protein